MKQHTWITCILFSSTILVSSAMADSYARYCGQTESSFNRNCGSRGTVYASASARGTTALRLLRQDYKVVRLEELGPAFSFEHVVIGGSDLEDPKVLSHLRRAYATGRTVAIAGASAEEIGRFHRLIGRISGDANCSSNRKDELLLYGLQLAIGRIPRQVSSYCMVAEKKIILKGRRDVRQWLRERFADSPPTPKGQEDYSASQLMSAAAPGDSESDNVAELVDQIHCSQIKNFADGGSIQIDNFVSPLRSLDQQEDYYAVAQELQFKSPPTTGAGAFQSLNTWDAEISATELLFETPETQTVTGTSYTNSKTTTVSGSVGWNQSQGLNASASKSVSVGKSETVSSPPIEITNESDPSTAEAAWVFKPSTANSIPPGSDFTPQTQWAWEVERDDYPDPNAASGTITFATAALMAGNVLDDTEIACTAAYPFEAWEIDAPIISGVAPTSASADGGTFTIQGTRMYPDLVSAVLLGGGSLDPANYEPQSDTQIQVTVPTGTRRGDTPVQVQTNSGALVSNSNITINIE